MNITNPNQVVLMQGCDVICRAPSTDDVMSMMRSMEAEDGLEDPTELNLEVVIGDGSEADDGAWMYLMRAFHKSGIAKWLVECSDPADRGSSLFLASGPPKGDFEVWTSLGVISRYRPECLIADHSKVRIAVNWFLNHHSACPELTWVPDFDAERDEDNSLY